MNFDVKAFDKALQTVVDGAVDAETELAEYQQAKATELYQQLGHRTPDSYLRCAQLVSRLMRSALDALTAEVGPMPRELRLAALQSTEGVWLQPAHDFIAQKQAYIQARHKAEASHA